VPRDELLQIELPLLAQA
jgi:hypothetical protein